MSKPFLLLLALCGCTFACAQKNKPVLKYPSVLWEISSPKTPKKSYLFGTYHISRKNVFHLSDSFYFAIRNCDVVATESLESKWEEEFFNRQGLLPEDLSEIKAWRGVCMSQPLERFDIYSLGFPNYEKNLAANFDEIPNIIKAIISRVYNEDFSEDTYLDHYIYKLGMRMNKISAELEKFRESDSLVLQATINRELERKDRNNYYNSSARVNPGDIFDAYIRNNLDELDSLDILADNSEAYREKMLYERNDNQARSIDSFIRNGKTIFAAVGCAHLPGKRGVIEALRAMGYTMRPVIATQKSEGTNNKYKDMIVKKNFSRQTTPDGMISVKTPGKLYSFIDRSNEEFYQSVDVDNDAYFLITRLKVNYRLYGHRENDVLKKLDSLFYDNIPGDILEKKPISRNGYKGYEITSRKKTGMFQKYQLFVTPAEVIWFKSYSTENYFRRSGYVDSFFNSIALVPQAASQPVTFPSSVYGGFTAKFPEQPVVVKNFSNDQSRWEYYAADKDNDYTLLRTFRYDEDFGGIDSVDLEMMRISYGESFFIDTVIAKKYTVENGRASLQATYRHKDNSISRARFLLRGNELVSVIAHGAVENAAMNAFLQSFTFTPYRLPKAEKYTDTFYNYTIQSPFYYDSLSLRRRAIAHSWIGQYKDNKQFVKLLAPTDRDDDGYLRQDTMGMYLYFNMNAGKHVRGTRGEDRDYEKLSPADTALVSKSDYAYLSTLLEEPFKLRKAWPPKEAGVAAERTFEVGWPGSSRVALIKLVRDPAKSRMAMALIQRDSLDTDHPMISVLSSFGIARQEKSKNTDNLSDMLARVKRGDTSFRKEQVRILKDSLFLVNEQYHPAIISCIREMQPSIKNYIDIKEILLKSLFNAQKEETVNFIAEYSKQQEDTIRIREACIQTLFHMGSPKALEKGMALLMEEPEYIGRNLFLGHLEGRYYFMYKKIPEPEKDIKKVDKQVFIPLTKYSDDIASLMYDPAWKDDVIKILSVLQEAGMLDKKTLAKHEKKLWQYARKELRLARQSDMERGQTAANKKTDTEDEDTNNDDDDDLTEYNRYDNTEKASAALLGKLYVLINSLQPQEKTAQLLNPVWQMHDENPFKEDMIMYCLRHRLPFPDSVVQGYLKKDKTAFGFINDAEDDSVDMIRHYHISEEQMVRYLMATTGRWEKTSLADSFVVVRKETVYQQDSIHHIYFCNAWSKKDMKTTKRIICKFTISAKTGRYLLGDTRVYSIDEYKMAAYLSAQDTEQLYFMMLYEDYRPLDNFFRTKNYSGFKTKNRW